MSHWYSKDAQPKHFIIGANGKQRDSTLRDARKHGWYPSVTGILDQLNKPALNNWSQNQIIEAAYHAPVITDDSGIADPQLLANYKESILALAFVDSNEARIVGGEIHAAIEQLWNSEIPEKHSEIARSTVGAIIDYCECEDFTPEKTVVGEGYGGMVDLHNNDFCIDHKTKDITDKQWEDYETGKNPRLAYPEMCMQLSAYDVALGSDGFPEHNHRRCINVFIDRKIPGRVIIHEWTADEIEMAYKKFMLLVAFWQLDKNYWPLGRPNGET